MGKNRWSHWKRNISVYTYSYQRYHLFLELKKNLQILRHLEGEWDTLLRELWFKVYLQHNFLISNWNCEVQAHLLEEFSKLCELEQSIWLTRGRLLINSRTIQQNMKITDWRHYEWIVVFKLFSWCFKF